MEEVEDRANQTVSAVHAKTVFVHVPHFVWRFTKCLAESELEHVCQHKVIRLRFNFTVYDTVIRRDICKQQTVVTAVQPIKPLQRSSIPNVNHRQKIFQLPVISEDGKAVRILFHQ